MDKHVRKLAHEALARTVNDGGSTFEGRTMLPFTPGVGFSVGIGGAILPATTVTGEALAWLARRIAQEYETTYVGTWLNEGKVYVDAVRYFGAHGREDAIACAREHGQLAIYDFAAGEAIMLDEDLPLVDPRDNGRNDR